jgi:WD40 repeat protein
MALFNIGMAAVLVTFGVGQNDIATLDVHGDPLPYGATGRFGTIRFREPYVSHIAAIAISKAAKLMAAGAYLDQVGYRLYGGYAPISLWDIPSGKKIRELMGHKNGVRELCFSADDNVLASAGGDSIVRIWDTTSWQEIGAFALQKGNKEGDQSERELAIHLSFQASTVLAIGSSQGRILFWDYKQNKVTRDVNLSKHSLVKIAISTSGTYFAACGLDSSIYIWDAKLMAILTVFKGHSARINSLVFSTDEKYLFSGADDKTVRRWQLSLEMKGAVIANYTSFYSGEVKALAIHPTKNYLLAGNENGNLDTFSLQENNKIRTLTFAPGDQAVRCLAFSDDGAYLAAAGGEGAIRLWYLPEQKEFLADAGHRRGIRQLLFLKNGSQLVSSGLDKTIRLWNVESANLITTLAGHQASVLSISLSPDEKHIYSTSFDGTLRIWDIERYQEILRQSLPDLTYEARPSPTGSLFASAKNKRIVISYGPNGKIAKELTAAGRGFAHFDFSTRGGLIAFSDGKSETNIKIMNTSDWTISAEFGSPRPDLGIGGIRFSPDQRLLAAVTGNGIWVWDLTKRQLLSTMRAPDLAGVQDLSFSPDGRMIAGGISDSQIFVWETYSGSPICILKGHKGSVDTVQFSPNQGILASGSNDQTILLWDLAKFLWQKNAQILAKKSLEELWHGLREEKPSVAYECIWEMVARREATVTFLKNRLLPVMTPSAARKHELVADLGSDSFKNREIASRELIRLVELCDAELLKEKEQTTSLELARRIENILKTKVITDPTRLQQLRAIAVLEYIGSPAAFSIVEELSRGGEESSITKEAKASARRKPQSQKKAS